MQFEIKSRRIGSVLFSIETGSMKLAVEAAVKRGCDLRGCDLRYSDLRGCDLRGCDLRYSDLRYSDLSESNLRGCDLRGCDLRESDLRGCDLRGCDLRESDLRYSDLRGCDLRGCDLTPIRNDLWAVLSSAPAEADGLRAAIAEGRIDGSTYEGTCACLVGTLANVRHCKYDAIPTLLPNSSRPAERFFMAITPGMTPENSEFSKLALEWVDHWLANMRGLISAGSPGSVRDQTCEVGRLLNLTNLIDSHESQ